MKAQVLLVTLLLTAGIAYADHHESANTEGVVNTKNINQQNLSRRPYTVTPAAKPEKFEGDVADVEETQAEKTYKKIQLHNLGRRPYAEK